MRYGISLYFAHLDAAAAACAQARAIGAHEAFASLHMPEDDPASFAIRLCEIAELAHRSELRLTVDISQNSLAALGLTPNTAEKIKEYGVDAVRVDFGLPDEDIAALSHRIPLQLNASTITPAWLDRLLAAGADLTRVEACHNFYPRRHTGLARELVAQRNAMWQEHGITVGAFVPGDGLLRTPVCAGLPTLEAHRGLHPLAAAGELAGLGCEVVSVGDPLLTERTAAQFAAYAHDTTVDLTIQVTHPALPAEAATWLSSRHRERTDPAAQLVRLEDSRAALRHLDVRGANGPRPAGTITIGNAELPRYQGEISISRTDLPADPACTPIGRVIPQDLPLLALIGPGTPVTLTRTSLPA